MKLIAYSKMKHKVDMIAFKNQSKIKEECLYLLRVYGFLKGINNQYLPRYHDEDGPSVYETELGIPEWLSLAEMDFENDKYLPESLANSWRIDYFTSIPVGANLNKVLLAFNLWLIADPIYGEWRYFNEQNKIVGQKIISLYNRSIFGPDIKFETRLHTTDKFNDWLYSEWDEVTMLAKELNYEDNLMFYWGMATRGSCLWVEHTDWKSDDLTIKKRAMLAARECLLSLLSHANNLL